MTTKRQIFGISGWSGNGKTYLITRLIPELKKRGLRVSTIKHAHHKFDIDKPGKDSYEHRSSGAEEVLISSSHRWALMHENNDEKEATLPELLASMTKTDVILVEGYKSEDFPRLEVYRGVGDQPPHFHQNKNVIAVATTLKDLETNLPTLCLDDIEAIANFIINFLFPDPTPQTSPKNLNDCYAAPDQMVSVNEARQLMVDVTNLAVGSTAIALDKCCGLVTSEDIHSSLNLPPADNSAVDGYAFSYDDLAAGPSQKMTCVGRTAAGDKPFSDLNAGECIKIFTGAQMPKGADTIAMIEDTGIEGNEITIPNGLIKGDNRRLAGEDIKEGELAIQKGTRLTPPHLARLASVGVAIVPVYEPLKVALFSTGDELQEPGSNLETGHIYDSNRYMLHTILQSYGVEVIDYGILPDNQNTIKSKLQSAALKAQLIITSGGVSMGDEDHVKTAVNQLGHLQFWKIAIKPGRPLAIGQVDRTVFVGLPGNPVAAMVCCLQFIRPIIAKLRGEDQYAHPAPFIARADFSMKKKPGRKEWLRGQYWMDNQGVPHVQKYSSQGSGLITSLTWANGLIELDEDCAHISEGENVKFIPLSELYR